MPCVDTTTMPQKFFETEKNKQAGGIFLFAGRSADTAGFPHKLKTITFAPNFHFFPTRNHAPTHR